MTKKWLYMLSFAVTLVILGQAFMAGKALASHVTTTFDPSILSFTPGQSVLGDGALIPNLIISQGGTGDVVYIQENNTTYIAYGANSTGVENDLRNGCLPKDYGIVDTTRVHNYEFSFTNNQTASNFSLNMVDWGDFLPNGACTDGVCGATLTAYDSNNNVVDTDSVTFTPGHNGLSRPTPEFGHTRTYGDACTGQNSLGNHYFTVSGSGISRVAFGFNNLGSIDPNSAIGDISFALEHDDMPVTPPVNDVCPNIDGIQNTIPADYHFDASGRNCVKWELGGPPSGSSSNSGQVLGVSTANTQNSLKYVLGVSTLAATGGQEVANLIFAIGTLSVSLGLKRRFSRN